MKNIAIKKACAVLSVLLGASSIGAAADQERDQINRSFSLPAKARVEVVAINGSVDIKAIDGDTASIAIERTARSRAELDCNKFDVEQVWNKLTIQSQNVGGEGCQTIQVRHRVLLSLPRHVNLNIHGVSGPINIGEIEGALRISGNSGNINLAQAGRGSRISGNSGTTTIKLQKLDARGLEISGNSGAIKLYVDEGVNVDVRVSGLSGTASSELSNVQFIKTGASDYYARIGSGGPSIYVSGNSGSILLTSRTTVY
jgi:hypothetical protein